MPFGLYVSRFSVLLTVFYLWLNSRYQHDNVNILIGIGMAQVAVIAVMRLGMSEALPGRANAQGRCACL
jgi:hypothetical protein